MKPRPYLAPTINAPFFSPGTTMRQCALSSRSCGMERSDVPIISRSTRADSSRRSAAVLAQSTLVMPNSIAAILTMRRLYKTCTVSARDMAHGLKQIHDLFDAILAQMFERFHLHTPHGTIQFAQCVEPLLSDLNRNETAVLSRPVARHKVTFFQAIQQARNIGIGCYHTSADILTAHACRARTSQNPKHIVLSSRQAMRP